VSYAVGLVRLLPWPFLGRLGIAFTEITLSVVVLSGSIVVGHELKAWREWFWDAETAHPWAPSARPSPTALVALPAGVPLAGAAPVAAAAPAAIDPAMTCRPLARNEQLLFVNKLVLGTDCVRTTQREDGIHLIVETYPGTASDLGVVAASNESAEVRVFAPTTWSSPVLVIRSTWAGNVGSAVVLTWRSREPTRLLGVLGQKVDVSTGMGGWPRLMVTAIDGTRRMYVWTGNAFSAQ